MNNVNLVGNLCKDPKFFEQDNNQFTAKFDIATEVGYDDVKKEQRVEFVPITVFGISSSFRDYLKKGRKVSISGRVGTDSYGKDGTKMYSTSVKTTNGNLRLLDAPKKAEQK